MNGVHFVLGSPNAYIHEPGILRKAGEWIGKYGRSVFIVSGEKSWNSCGSRLAFSLDESGIRYEMHRYRGECSYEEMERLKALVDSGVDLICGVGGGKVMDTSKALADALGKPFVAIPTLAATCAAVANLSIMYTEDGVYLNFPVYVRGTLLCLVDTEIIAQAPARYLAAGIADTLAKWIEAPMSATGRKHNLPTIGGLQAAKLCYDTLIQHSAQALEDARQGIPSEALQQVIDANILFSGLVGGLGEDNCRTAAAHAIHNGLTAIQDTHEAYHGEKVAYGILVQLVLEHRSKHEMDEMLAFYKEVGLPHRLDQIGIHRELTNEEWNEIARVSLLPEGTMANMPFAISSEMVIRAIREVESW
ncbi:MULTISPECIES: iron-containing alcohol dehydrogenase family protein [unclassified Paenibacillus]|uniref:iron-containing alcohol dehydrogenase family protein n=1 Tax=unclassified Paenibacillus TaxID=185978 RepID=UPI001AE8F903|nr:MULTISPECIES: iron-containing alcohol dehydrogenase family protein [unclassified Paenibacillus]MBP1155888.1 glycerol dehydrogenase [Paenibacillus sp. PvP091]MBP1168726.1 glycerol dehydrogenase [Paenibacillus sp. PvR098]MBP2439754.1 glycerol dehydrogenase [Paenibacillus sp. PvP052]